MQQQLIRQIGELDVFALQVFRAIFESGHANIAARQLDVSPPKISRSLNSLRQAFTDELFYRRAQGLRATPLAEQLYPIVCQLTDSLFALGHCAFTATQEQHSPCLQLAVCEGFVAPLALAITTGPHQSRFQLHSWQNQSADLIHRGELDMGICLSPNEHPELSYEALGTPQKLCLVGRDDHPIWQASMPTLEQLCEFPVLSPAHPNANGPQASLALFCQREGIAAPSQIISQDKEEWYANLLTQDSLALVTAAEQELLTCLPRLKVKAMDEGQSGRLNSQVQPAVFYLVEKPMRYRRYSEQQRVEVIELLRGLLS
ncbi:LysR family transcriptional regulator [Shewanella cyperi]|uniref:LysR family transcriptional regulator n=1 Tax=Shewanella cyperi TaxID=2814292 RepID=UPI001A94EBF9|nr:LysR family transcriptional regulator [Shewanella cyperi]QSX39631.1 LysR family transcriptional regulator [Shewanella cyperi]